jgi:hypothetical protein
MKLGWKLLIVVAIAALTVCIGCGVLGNPDPCDRKQAMRDALEDATGRDCDLITTEDLADVRRLRISGACELKRSDFTGLGNLHSVDLSRCLLDSDIFDILNVSHITDLYLARSGLRGGTWVGGDSGYYETIYSCLGPDASVLNPEWFEGLADLARLTLCTTDELPSDIERNLVGRGVTIEPLYLSCGLAAHNRRSCR